MVFWLNLGGDLLVGSDSLKRRPFHVTTRGFPGEDDGFVRKAGNYPRVNAVKHKLSEASLKPRRAGDKRKT